MLAKTESVAFIGTEARLVSIEVDIKDGGLPTFRTVGLAAPSVREAEQRTRSAIEISGAHWPKRRIIANLAPGVLRKEGTHFDLAIALGVLAADSQVDSFGFSDWIMVGELALDGSVRPVRGTLPAAITCRQLGRRGLICPAINAPEAALIDDIEVVPVDSLSQCMQFFHGSWTPPAVLPGPARPSLDAPDMSDVRGHEIAKRAMEIAAAGGHNLLMKGPPGSGKTMLARRLPGILPSMSLEESLEVTQIYSVAGLLTDGGGLLEDRPFRAPHHHISVPGIVGGGAGLARPGEVSLAHLGVLFLDEMSLFAGPALESLRGPVEDGSVRIARSGGAVTYPCRFSLVAAMNPCPCGYLGDGHKECSCSRHRLDTYHGKISGPLMDRIDIQVEMIRATEDELLGMPVAECSSTIRERVEVARLVQNERFGSSMRTNAQVDLKELDPMKLPGAARIALSSAIENGSLTGRGLTRTMRVARTIADLEGASAISEPHVVEALCLRLDQARTAVLA